MNLPPKIVRIQPAVTTDHRKTRAAWYARDPDEIDLRTRGMNDACYRAFNNMRDCMWRSQGQLPDDDAALADAARITSKKFSLLREKLSRVFQVRDGWWHDPWIDAEVQNWLELREKRRRAGHARAERMGQKG